MQRCFNVPDPGTLTSCKTNLFPVDGSVCVLQFRCTSGAGQLAGAGAPSIAVHQGQGGQEAASTPNTITNTVFPKKRPIRGTIRGILGGLE